MSDPPKAGLMPRASVCHWPPGRHFRKEWTEKTRACDGDKQRQIERVKDRTRGGKRERLSSRLSSETAVVKARVCTALHRRLLYIV